MKLYKEAIFFYIVIAIFAFVLQTFALEKVKTEIDEVSGLQIIIFETQNGKVNVHLPEEIKAGDMISGTIEVIPTGTDKNTVLNNLDILNKRSIEINNESVLINDKVIKFKLPKSTTGGVTYIVLNDENGEEISRNYITYQNSSISINFVQTPSPWEYQTPPLGKAGIASNIKGPFDGNFGTTSIMIGQTSIRKIAESPRILIYENPLNMHDNTELLLIERGVEVKRKYKNIKVVKLDENQNQIELLEDNITDHEDNITDHRDNKSETASNMQDNQTSKDKDEYNNKKGYLEEKEILISAVEDKNENTVTNSSNNNTKNIDAPVETNQLLKDKYTVQIASYKKEGDANNFAKTLKSKGYPVIITKAEIPEKGSWYRVRIGNFKTKNEAKNFGKKLTFEEPLVNSMFVSHIQ